MIKRTCDKCLIDLDKGNYLNLDVSDYINQENYVIDLCRKCYDKLLKNTNLKK